MADLAVIGLIAGLIATVGLWWFRLVLPSVKRMTPTTRYGIYAAIWLAYFILSSIAIARA